MNFVWHDGGRAACGFVGLTGDCATRSIAIATGGVYRDVYDELGKLEGRTARSGVSTLAFDHYLTERGWEMIRPQSQIPSDLPKGVIIVDFEPSTRRGVGHVACVIDHTVYDTWNPFEDPDYKIGTYWRLQTETTGTTLPIKAPAGTAATQESDLTQREYERILNRVQALHRTASNEASTEGEIRNALRAMQALMLEHNLSRQDIVKDDEVQNTGMTRRACPLSGRRACQWEFSLANYLVDEIFPMVQHYKDRNGHRTLFWFYGPVDDVQQTLELFREMLLTIATSARLKYGGHSRGSGASYAEGYVNGLPRRGEASTTEANSSQTALINQRALAIRSAAIDWLAIECKVRLRKFRSSGRGNFDPSAHGAGQRDGAKHTYSDPRTKQITHQRGNA